MSKFMQNSDAFSWAMEEDPGLRSTIVTIFVMDRAPDWDVMVDRYERISRTLAMFRSRVVSSPPPAPPRWELDPDFDLAYHVRRLTVPPPCTMQEVMEIARRAQMDDFDRARPLWEVTLVEGLENGQAAVVAKLHHSLTDGVGGVQIAMTLFDLEREAPDRGPLPPEPPVVTPGPLSSLLDTMEYDLGVVRSVAESAVKSTMRAPGTFARTARRPLGAAKDIARTVGSIYRTVRPIDSTGSSLMTGRRLVRHLDVHEVPLAPLKAAGRVGGGSLNDAFLGGVTAAYRIYHQHHGEPLDELHVCMPVSLRKDADAMGGNLITLMRFDLPVDIADPAERIARIRERTRAIRSEPSLPYTQLIAGTLNLVPRPYIASMLKKVDLLASDVPGIPVPVYIGGAKLLMQYPFGPTIGAAVNVTLMSYVDTCALGINVDTGAVPDHDFFHECLVAGFEEVMALAPAQDAAPPGAASS